MAPLPRPERKINFTKWTTTLYVAKSSSTGSLRNFLLQKLYQSDTHRPISTVGNFYKQTHNSMKYKRHGCVSKINYFHLKQAAAIYHFNGDINRIATKQERCSVSLIRLNLYTPTCTHHSINVNINWRTVRWEVFCEANCIIYVKASRDAWRNRLHDTRNDTQSTSRQAGGLLDTDTRLIGHVCSSSVLQLGDQELATARNAWRNS
jgi:hypothetical protein